MDAADGRLQPVRRRVNPMSDTTKELDVLAPHGGAKTPQQGQNDGAADAEEMPRRTTEGGESA